MKKSELRKLIREELQQMSYSPQTAEPETKPDIDTEPDTAPRRRKLRRPSTAPETRPKAMFNENEKDLLKKITSRFSNLKQKK
jgi:hypothetical protein